MLAGCFSWCRLRTRRGAKKQSAEMRPPEKLKRNPPVIVPVTSVEKQCIEPKSDEKSSENSRMAVPTKTEYTMATGKEVLTLLQSAAGVMPVPLLRDAIGVALKIIQVCEDALAVEQKVKGLQERVGHLMIAILHHVTPKNGDGLEEDVVKAVKDIEEDIKDLLITLGTINQDLTEISSQKRWAIAIYKELNRSKLEDCITQLSTALERFKLSSDLRNSDLLQNLRSRLERVAHKVDNIDNKVEDIHKYLFRSKRSATLLPPDTVVRQQMPLKPEVFHGRDDFVKDIARLLLQEETSRVCILGPGGMGKTSASLAVVESPLLQERFPPDSRVWVPCIEATSATLLLEILYVQLQVPGDKQVTLKKIIFNLDEIKRPCLILLDNFETPWNAPGNSQKQVEDILRQLAELRHIAIFITMRGRNPPCNKAITWQSKNIEPTDEEACLRIYHDNNPSSKNDPDVGRLLTVLGHMPFAVTLMANLGMEGKSTAKELLDAWVESGPDILSDRPEQSMNRSISLSVESDLVKRNPNAIILLAILSLLPAGTTKENLRWWAPAIKTSMIPSAIATLSRAGLLVENKQQNLDSPVLFVVPVVQSFMQQNDQEQHPRIPEELRKQIRLSCCQYVLDHACRFDDSTFPVNSKALASDDTNIQSILFDTSQHTSPSDRTIEALIAFSWYRCDTKPSLEIANKTVTVANTSVVKRYRASAVWCLGKTYQQLGEYHHSYDHLQEAYELFNSLPPGELESQRLGSQCGINLVNVARLASHYQQAVTLARDVELKCAALSDDFTHARSLVMLGLALKDNQQPQEALEPLERAKAMMTAVGNTLNLGRACKAIARLYLSQRRLPEALDAIQEAWKHTESSASPSDQAYVSLEFGVILFSLNRDTEAWKYIEIALMKASFIGHRLEVARALEFMGFGYLRRGDYQNAYGAYEAAAEKYHDSIDAYIGTTDAWVEERCKENMNRIKQKQENPDAEVGFHRVVFYRYGDVDKSLFYPLVKASANDVPISGS